MYNQNGQNGTTYSVIKLGKSALFLTAAIGYSVYVLFELLNGIVGGSQISTLMDRIMSMDGGYSALDYSAIHTISGIFTGMTVFTTVLSMIPAMVILAGIWMVFAAARRSRIPGSASAGLTMIRVIVIIQLVFFCILMAILEIVCVIAIAGITSVADYYGVSGTGIGVIIFLMILLAAIAAIVIIYYLKLNGTIGRLRQTLITGQPDADVSLFVEIICYLSGGMSAIMALMSLAGFSVFGFLASGGTATANICFGILLRQYRDRMDQLIENPQLLYQAAPQQAPVQQPYQAAPQQAPVQQPYQAMPQQAPVQQPYQAAPQQAPVQQPYQAAPQQAPVQQPYQAMPQQPAGSTPGQTDALPYYNETSVLSGQMIHNGELQLVRLIRQKTGESICINKAAFWFGKEAGNVDYCITDNTAVSRRHALITIRNNECFVQDNHSTNHVFVNGHMIEAGVDTPICSGDRVRMGDEEFTVSIG